MTAFERLMKEFPDFDVNTLPAIPADWVDVSWHNDTCPSFEVAAYAAFNVYVFVDYEDPAKREHDGESRFYIIKVAANTGDTETLLETASWADVLGYVADKF